MNRVDVRIAKVSGQLEREFEIVVVDDKEELGFFARIAARVLDVFGIDLDEKSPR